MNETNIEPKLDLELDDNLNGILVITCQQCGHVTKKSLSELKRGSDVKCKCDMLFHFTGDDLSGIQDSFNSLKKTLQSFR